MDALIKQRILDKQKSLRPVIKESRTWYNASGYYDPTASLAIARITKEENKRIRKQRKHRSKLAKKALRSPECRMSS